MRSKTADAEYRVKGSGHIGAEFEPECKIAS